MRAFWFTPALIAMAACVPVETPETVPPPSQECRANVFQGLIGQKKSAIAAMQFDPSTRIIGPNTAVTADYRQERLNIEYDAKGVISKVSCY